MNSITWQHFMISFKGTFLMPKVLLADSWGIERSRYRGGIGGRAGGGRVFEVPPA
jgi:hypothetical protein